MDKKASMREEQKEKAFECITLHPCQYLTPWVKVHQKLIYMLRVSFPHMQKAVLV